jgi:type IV pilus assembly protein PilE
MLSGRRLGFTVLELLVALVVGALLATIALPSYLGSLHKGRRADAIAALQQLALAQGRWRTEHDSYAGSLAQLQVPARSPAGHYLLRIEEAGAHGFTATAEADATSPQFGDRACRRLRLSQVRAEVRYASTDAEGVEAAETRNACWSRT